MPVIRSAALRRILPLAFALGSVLPLGLGGCADSGDADPDTLAVAVVNGEKIARGEFEKELARLPKALQRRYQDASQRERYLRELVDRRLLLQEARRRGIDQDPLVRGKVEDLERRLLVDALQRAVAQDAVSEDAVKVFYEQHLAEYTEERVRVRQILVRDDEEAARLRADLEAGADFEELAKAHSVDPSARRGGDLGYVVRGRMDPAFEAAAFALRKPGERSPVVKTRFGYHLIELIEKPVQKPRSYDSVKLTIRQRLQREAVEKMLEKLRSEADIEISLAEES